MKDVYYAKYLAPGPADEFLIYSKFLTHEEDPDIVCNFDFFEINESEWGSGGRVHGFVRNETGTPGKGAYMHMLTNSPKSAEVVRISSNPFGSPSVTGVGLCEGGQYRSAIFELANYHPFHFSATVNGDGTIVAGENEEVVDNLKDQIKLNHIKRLQNNECTIELGFILSDLLTNLERISDHCSNIAGCVIEIAHNSLGMHGYTKALRRGNEVYDRHYKEYSEKYSLKAE